jgi:hypothetical protein
MSKYFRHILTYSMAIFIIGTQLHAAGNDSSSLDRVKDYLISFSSTEIAYQGIHSVRTYGSFEDLQADQFINEAYNYSNMLDNYQFRFYLNEDRTGFSVLAIPDNESLPTMLIDESQIMYELTPYNLPDSFSPDTYAFDETRTDSSPQLDEPEEILLSFSLSPYGGYESLQSVYVRSLETMYSCEPVTEETEPVTTE